VFFLIKYLFPLSKKHNYIDLYITFIQYYYMFPLFTLATIRQGISSQRVKGRGLSLQTAGVMLL